MRSNYVKYFGRLLFVLQNHSEVLPARRPFRVPKTDSLTWGAHAGALRNTRFCHGWALPSRHHDSLTSVCTV